MRIYFDNAASTPMYPEVIDAMVEKMKDCHGNPSSIHQAGRISRATIEEARKLVAESLNASVGEVFFTSGGTEANNTVLKCAVRDLGINRIISSPIEHPSVLNTCRRLTDAGVRFDLVDVDRQGRPRLSHLEELLTQNEAHTLVSLMHANNEIGTKIDLSQVANLCKAKSCLLHSDTVQTIGHFPIDIQESPVDFLSASAHKFHGPKGIGFLFMRQGITLKPLLEGGNQERNLRSGTENVAAIHGLALALQISLQRLSESRQHIEELKTKTIREFRRRFPQIVFNGDPEGPSLYTVISFTVPKSLGSDLLVMNLDIEGISVSGGSACASGTQKSSHVMAHLDQENDGQTIRISFSEFNTTAEVNYLIEKLGKILHD